VRAIAKLGAPDRVDADRYTLNDVDEKAVVAFIAAYRGIDQHTSPRRGVAA